MLAHICQPTLKRAPSTDVIAGSILQLLARELTEPAQCNGGLRTIDFVAAVECAYLHPLKSGAFD
jgi:hypothetical protein